jgi:Family of unknown function (DUF6152)
MSRSLAAFLLLGILAFAPRPAIAHHSMSSFEFFATTIEGTVQAYKYTNPHCILVLKVRGQNGGTVVWHLEGDAPALADRAGFGPNTFRRGDRLKLQVQRLKNGKPGGFWSFRMVIMHNGREFAGHQCISSRDGCN